MNKKVLSFNQKVQLYKDLKNYFKTSRKVPVTENIKSIQDRLEKWGNELRIRQNYYDV
jgi:hypothetical protein